MAVTINPALASAIGMPVDASAWGSAVISALGSSRRVRLTRNGIDKRVAALAGAMTSTSAGITSFGRVAAGVVGAEACDFSDGADWRLWVDGGAAFERSVSWVIGVDCAIPNLGAAAKAFGFVPGFLLAAPASYAGSIAAPASDPFTAVFPTSVKVKADSLVTPGAAELVTFGMPVPYSEAVTAATLSKIRVRKAGVEVPVSVRAGYRYWHKPDTTRLSHVIIQTTVDLTAGDVVLTVDAVGRNTSLDVAAQPIFNGYVAGTGKAATDPAGRVLRHPRCYALHNPSFIAACGLVPPFSPPTSADGASQQITNSLMPKQITEFPYNTAFGYGSNGFQNDTYEGFLFGRPETLTMCSFYVFSDADRCVLLRHAALSKQAYFNYINTTTGYWEWPNVSPNDGRYLYPMAAFLSSSLLGDDTQFDAALIDKMVDAALASDTGSAGARDGYTAEYQAFTERNAGLVAECCLMGYRITGRAASKTELDLRLAALNTMQTTPASFDTANSWPMTGLFRHSYMRHESGIITFGWVAPGVSGTNFAVDIWLDPEQVAPLIGQVISCGAWNATLISATRTVVNPQGGGTYSVQVSDPITASNNYLRREGYLPNWRVDRVGSTWMSENLARTFWHAHWFAGSTIAGEMLRKLANVIDESGFASARRSSGAYTLRPEWQGSSLPGGTYNTNRPATYVMYLMRDLKSGLGRQEYEQEQQAASGFTTDQHAPEMAFVLSVGAYFETDPVKKSQLLYRCGAIRDGVMNLDYPGANGPFRLPCWQWRSGSVRVYEWVAQQ